MGRAGERPQQSGLTARCPASLSAGEPRGSGRVLREHGAFLGGRTASCCPRAQGWPSPWFGRPFVWLRETRPSIFQRSMRLGKLAASAQIAKSPRATAIVIAQSRVVDFLEGAAVPMCMKACACLSRCRGEPAGHVCDIPLTSALARRTKGAIVPISATLRHQIMNTRRTDAGKRMPCYCGLHVGEI